MADFLDSGLHFSCLYVLILIFNLCKNIVDNELNYIFL